MTVLVKVYALADDYDIRARRRRARKLAAGLFAVAAAIFVAFLLTRLASG